MHGQVLTGTVTKVVDGDTYILSTIDNQRIRIRMYGIDTPERAMPFCNVATKYLVKLCLQQQVTVVIKDIDRYRRIVGFTYLGNGVELSHEMLRAGLAWHYRQYNQDDDMAQLESQARQSKVGLWQDKYPVAPWVVRKWNRNRISTKAIYSDKDLLIKANKESYQ